MTVSWSSKKNWEGRVTSGRAALLHPCMSLQLERNRLYSQFAKPNEDLKKKKKKRHFNTKPDNYDYSLALNYQAGLTLSNYT